MPIADTLFSSLGFAPGVVRGARSFSVDGEGRLSGVVFRDSVWYPGVNNAECLKGSKWDPYLLQAFHQMPYGFVPPMVHMLPAPEGPHQFATCHCGFYGFYDGSDDYNRYLNARVSGVVEGWGETLIGTRGFRCSKARIVALTVHDRPDRAAVTNQIRDHYWDVPVFPDFETMVAEFPPDKGEQ